MNLMPRMPARNKPGDYFLGRRFRSPLETLLVAAIVAVASAFTYRLVFFPASNLMPLLGLAVVVAFIIWRPVIGVALFLVTYPMVPKSGSVNLMKTVMLGLTVINVAIWAWQMMRVSRQPWLKGEYVWIYIFLFYTCFSPFQGAMHGFTIMDWARDIAPLLNLLMIPVLVDHFSNRSFNKLVLITFVPIIYTMISYFMFYVGRFFGLKLPGILFIYQISTFHFGMLFCIGLLLFLQRVRHRAVYLATGVMSLLTTAMMPTRTIWFSIGFTLAQMLSLYKRFRRAALAMGGALIVAMVWIVFSPAPQYASYRSDRGGSFLQVQSERAYGIKHRDVGVLNRATEFEQAKKVFLKSPVIGVGYGYWYTIWQYLVSGTGMPGFWTTNNVHNDIMNVLVKGGVFGALLFAVMLFQLTRKLYGLRKRHQGTVRALWPTIAVIAVYNSLFVGTTTPVYQTREAIFFLVIILALGLCAFEMDVDDKDAKA